MPALHDVGVSARAFGVAVTLALGLHSGCAQWGPSAAAAQASARQQAQARASEPNDLRESITLEFDASGDVVKQTPNGEFVVRAFQVGFFDGDSLIRTVEIQRARAKIAGTRVRIEAPVVALSRPPSRNADVRVRSVGTGSLGPWSESAGSVRLPVEGSRASRRERPRSTGSRESNSRRRAVTVAQLNRHHALKSALEPLLGPGLDAAQVSDSFSSVQELALAIVVARTHDVPLARICEAMQQDRTRTLTQSLESLRLPLDASRTLKAARAEARTLVRGSSSSR